MVTVSLVSFTDDTMAASAATVKRQFVFGEVDPERWPA
jgi:hypothetical protein